MKFYLLILIAAFTALLSACGAESGYDLAGANEANTSATFPATVVSDTLSFPGSLSNYTMSRNSTGYALADAAGNISGIPVNVKRLDFADGSVGLGSNSNAAQVYRLYQAAFGRKPDLEGLSYWINRMDRGLNLRQVADAFFTSAEFISLYGATPAAAELVTRYYQNVLHRNPDQEGFAFWVNALNEGRFTPVFVLLAFSESPENIAQINTDTQYAIRFTSVGNIPDPNVALVSVGKGNYGTLEMYNRATVSVTLCRPGTSTCQTIDEILVDTGSYGLRLGSKVTLRSDLQLPAVADGSGQAIGNCAVFGATGDRVRWGALVRADLKIAGMVAPSTPIQLVDDPDKPAFFPIPDACRNQAPTVNAATEYNGILGIGHARTDCGAACESAATIPPVYFGCTGNGCTPGRLPINDQLTNPVVLFGAGFDNGTVIHLPAIPEAGAVLAVGTLTFGIGTQANNQLGNAKVLALDPRGMLFTTINGTRARAFFDSGAPSIAFYDSTIPQCANGSPYYCPSAPLSVAAINSAGNVNDTVNFMIVAPPTSLSLIAALPLGRPNAERGALMLWGLPFFFGRSVFTAIQGRATPAGTGPYIAY